MGFGGALGIIESDLSAAGVDGTVNEPESLLLSGVASSWCSSSFGTSLFEEEESLLHGMVSV